MKYAKLRALQRGARDDEPRAERLAARARHRLPPASSACTSRQRLLADGAPVTGVDNLDPYYDVALKEARLARLAAHPGFRFARVDLADAEAAAALFRDGGFTARGPSRRAARRALFARQSRAPTSPTTWSRSATCSKAAGTRGVAHLVYASSSSVYGANHALPFSEDQNVDHPVSLYAATKKANELMAHSYSHLYRHADDGPALLHRLRTVGPARHGADAVHQGDPRRHADPRVQRREDAPRFHLRRRHRRRRRARARPAARADGDGAPYAIYNIGNHEAVELETFIATLERLLGPHGDHASTLPMQPGDVPATYAAIDRLSALDRLRAATPLADGLARFVAWYREYYGVPA